MLVQSMINMSNDQKTSCYALVTHCSDQWLIDTWNQMDCSQKVSDRMTKSVRWVSKRKYFFSLNFLSVSNIFVKTIFLKKGNIS